MSLKLFRSTEFAQSRGFSPEVQRRALHPVWLIMAAAFWIAIPGNWALWAALTRTPGMENGAIACIALRIALLIGVASTGLMCLLMWRWTTRLAVSVALIATALAGIPASAAPRLFSWQAMVYLLVIAVVPCIWMWRTRLQRLAIGRNLRLVAFTCLASALLFGLLLAISVKDLAALNEKVPALRSMVSPYGSSAAVAALEKVLLRR